MKIKKKGIPYFVISVAVLLGIMYLLQLLFMPKYMGAVREGALVAEYYNETAPHDVIFIGDCEVYENFSPITLWEKYGITSFIRGTPQQLIWQSYYLLEETLQYEKPKAVVFNVLSMKYGEPQNEAYNRMTLDGMRLSPIKIKDIEASMMPEENILTYIFPFFRYHSRWSELTSDDTKYLFDKKTVSHNGYLMRVDVKSAGQPPMPQMLADYTFSDVCYKYLDMMTELCKKNGIDLILIKAPSIYPHWYDEWDQQIVDYADKNGLTYINFLKLGDETGIDLRSDTYDAGLHLNLYGAEKLSAYLGGILKRDFGLADHRGDPVLESIWADKIAFYNETKAAQEQELAEFGYMKSLVVEKEKK